MGSTNRPRASTCTTAPPASWWRSSAWSRLMARAQPAW